MKNTITGRGRSETLFKGKIMPAMILMGLLALVMVPVATAATPASPHVVIYSTYDNSSEYLYVPVNSSGLQAYPDWHVFLYGSAESRVSFPLSAVIFIWLSLP